MALWTISPSNSGATINSATGKINFNLNNTTNKTFTVTYTDDYGNTASQTITQLSGIIAFGEHGGELSGGGTFTPTH